MSNLIEIQENVLIINEIEEISKADYGQLFNKMQKLGYNFGQFNFVVNKSKSKFFF